MEHDGPPSQATCTHVPVETSPLPEMMQLSMVFGSPSLQSASVWHSLGVVMPQPPSGAWPLELEVESEIPLLVVLPAPPLLDALPVLEAPTPVLSLPPRAPFEALHATNAATSADGNTAKIPIDTRADILPMRGWSPRQRGAAMEIPLQRKVEAQAEQIGSLTRALALLVPADARPTGRPEHPIAG
jgi:hypothetical protein